MAAHILVADDEARIREVVQYTLERQGYRVTLVTHGRAALERARQSDIDLVVLDVMMPELDGLDVCRELRRDSSVPVLFLSSKSEEFDRVLGLELGGDDYLTKPFGTRELVARVKALLRRGSAGRAEPEGDGELLSHDGVTIDLARHEVRCGEHVLRLTATEFGVLAALFERPGVVLSRGQLMQRAYPFDNLVTERTLDTHVRRIRAKFRALGRDPIETVHGVGYKAAGA
ncbi:MAG: response regulator transcription factor [Sandaracinaceae bacterium]|nr:response regulator transcription factor [Myxococcales bacterium]MCB9661575.1 response regulator transcription factor [Sandaracinaceae bacterium]